MTQIENARAGNLTSEVKYVAKEEQRGEEYIQSGIADGSIVILANVNHGSRKPVGVGRGLRTKVNANIGTSPESSDLDYELRKLKVSIDAGADAVMDLSTGKEDIIGAILEHSTVPVGSVPIYAAAIAAVKSKRALVEMRRGEIFAEFRRHAEIGVDFFVVHAGVTKSSLERLRNEGRVTNLVSRGGSFMLQWMIHNGKENPLYEGFDEILAIAKEYDVTLSIGDGMRPGSLADATDRPQIDELITQGELIDRAREAGVQAMVEGPGHIPLGEIEANVVLEKKLCRGAPFYVLGPVVTDIAPGYDHITAAIGGAVAAAAGADFLCYCTPSEHLRLPTVEDVKEGVVASLIAAHAADIAKGVPGALARDLEMAKARKARHWDRQMEIALDGDLPRRMRDESKSKMEDVCTMCGEFCALKILEEYLE